MKKELHDIASNIKFHYIICPVDLYVETEPVPHRRVPLYSLQNDQKDRTAEGFAMLMSSN